MHYPLLAFCERWLYVFSNIGEAESYIEPIDVENGEWKIFDSKGDVLDLTVEKRPTHGIWAMFSRSEETVRIREPDPPVVDVEGLRRSLVEYVIALVQVEKKRLRIDIESLNEMQLDELEKCVLEFYTNAR